MPGSASGERGVALKVDGDEASRPAVEEVGERVRAHIWIRLRQWAAGPKDETFA